MLSFPKYRPGKEDVEYHLQGGGERNGSALKKIGDHRPDLAELGGFVDEIRRAELPADRPVPRAGLIAEHNDGHGRILLMDELQKFDPAAIAQVDIEQDEIGGAFCQQCLR